MDTSKIKKIQGLFHKYFSNQIDSKEVRELMSEVNNCTDEELIPLFQKHWMSIYDDEPLSEQKRDELYTCIKKGMQRRKVISFKRYWAHIAASILILLTTSLAVTFYIDNKEMHQMEEENVVIQSGENEPSTIELPDGTVVRLNAKSTLSYQRNFGGANRKVSLSGEGYFQVKRNETKPFIVGTGSMDVVVLGTTFNVYAYKEKDIVEMSLIKGRVRVITPNKTINVRPNEKVTYHKLTGELRLKKTANNIETAWLKKELIFRHETLASVFDKLERRYGVTFAIDNKKLLEDRYTGAFVNENINTILDILKIHYEFKYTIDNSKIYIITE